MAVPSSGELSLQSIANEMLQDDYNASIGYTNISLGAMGSGTSPYSINTGSSSYPTSSAPHSMSEFYGYDNDASSTVSFTSSAKSNSSNVCLASLNRTLYHNGSGTYPTVGDTVSTNAAGTTFDNGGWYRLPNGTRFALATDFSFPVAIPTGEVTAVSFC